MGDRQIAQDTFLRQLKTHVIEFTFGMDSPIFMVQPMIRHGNNEQDSRQGKHNESRLARDAGHDAALTAFNALQS